MGRRNPCVRHPVTNMTIETERERRRRERDQQAEEIAKKFDAGIIQRKIDEGIQKKVDAHRVLFKRVLREVDGLPEPLRTAIEEAVR
jgi:hypothetical protein